MLPTFAFVAAAVAVGLAGVVLEASRPGLALSAELVCLAVGFAGGAALGFPAGWICRAPGRGLAGGRRRSHGGGTGTARGGAGGGAGG
mgnify:CR=1 FL=1